MTKKRLRLLIRIVLLAVLACALVYRYFWMSRPVGTGPAGPRVSRSAFAQKWTSRKVLLLGIGDSITDGFGASTGRSYFERLIRNPEDEFDDMQDICVSEVLPNLESRNISVSGSTSIEHLETIRRDIKPQDADTLGLIVMTTGGNDIIHNYGKTPPKEGAMYGATFEQAIPWIESFEKRLNTMIDLIEKRFPGGCHIFVADIYDFTDTVGDVQRVGLPAWPDGINIHAAYNAAIHRCAQQRNSVHLVPMYKEFLGHGFRCRQFWNKHYRKDDPYYWYGSNLEDPNDRGYDAIRQLFLIEMANTLHHHAKNLLNCCCLCIIPL